MGATTAAVDTLATTLAGIATPNAADGTTAAGTGVDAPIDADDGTTIAGVPTTVSVAGVAGCMTGPGPATGMVDVDVVVRDDVAVCLIDL